MSIIYARQILNNNGEEEFDDGDVPFWWTRVKSPDLSSLCPANRLCRKDK
jgi:hypothetical protein